MNASPQAIKDAIRARARELRFDAVGFTGPDIDAAGRRLTEFLAAGWQGDMEWLEAKRDRRADPRTLWPEVRSIVMLGLNYGPAIDPLQPLAQRERGTISVYAQGRDYHDVLKSRLKQLAGWLQSTHGGEVKVFVDTRLVCLPSHPPAERAGLGGPGKHPNQG